jgi:hypothetical protein
MTVPIRFRKSAEPSIASYNWTDVSEGTGIVKYYLFHTQEETTDQYGLTTQTLYSNYPTTAATANNTSFTKELDLDFDLVFNKPQIVKGYGWANIFVQTSSTSATGSADIYVIVKVVHYDGSTETILDSVRGDTKEDRGVSGSTKRYHWGLKFDLTSGQNYKKGDTLRITVEVWVKMVAGEDTLVSLTHDPINSGGDVDNYPSSSTVLIPYNLDL